MQTEFRFLDAGAIVTSDEEWREVAGFPGYEVSTLGRFRNKRTGKYLNGTLASNGYVHIGLFRAGAQHTRLAHRLVAETFMERPSPKHTDVNHRNKTRTDNRLHNLEWATRSHNSRHAKAS